MDIAVYQLLFFDAKYAFETVIPLTSMFSIASMFTDHMVLQQQARVPVWGTGVNGTEVKVTFGNQSLTVEVQQGTWHVELQPLEAGGPYEMAIRSGCEFLVLRDVWVGEVWLAAGQSNMVQQLLFTENGVEECATANVPNLRFFTTPRRPFENARVPGWDFIGTFTDSATWQVCTPQSALHFCAIGYHFGRLLERARQVPVGIISCNFGGTPIQSWMSESYLEHDSELKPILYRYREFVSTLDRSQYENEFAIFVASIYKLIAERGDIERRVRELGLEGYRQWIAQNPLILPDPPYGPQAYQRPCGFYHTMLQTVAPYTIQGVLWYQGESNANADEVGMYQKLLTAMIANWRADWQNPTLPFLIVQLTSYASTKGPNGFYWAYIREAQEAVADTVPRTALVVTLDLGEHDIHPIYKREVADRLFRAAQALVYGEPVDYQSTRYRCSTIADNRFVADFDDVGNGLSSQSDVLEGFVVCGADRSFLPAQARIVGNQVEVSSPLVQKPIAVRYAWQNMPSYSLIGKNGLPVAPFRTDTFPPD